MLFALKLAVSAFSSELSLESWDVDTTRAHASQSQKHCLRFLLQRRSSWTRAGPGTQKIALSLSLRARTKDRIPLVCSVSCAQRRGPTTEERGWGQACLIVLVRLWKRVSGGQCPLNIPYDE